MKRTSHSRFGVRALGNGFFLFILFILIILVLIWRSFFTGIFWRVSSPLLQTGKLVFVPIDFMLGGFSGKAALAAQNAQLQTQLASTSAALADRDVLYQENVDLKARLGRDAKVQTILAGVLLAPPAAPYDTLLIDAGSAQDVALGDMVSSGGTTLIGTVSEVHATTATVTLYSAPGQRYQAFLLHSGAVVSVPNILASSTSATSNTTTKTNVSVSNKSTPVELEGQGGGSLRAEVPAGTPVKVGDSIVTPGVVNGFAGVVSAVTQNSSESFETIYVTLPTNPLELRFVEIWRKE